MKKIIKILLILASLFTATIGILVLQSPAYSAGNMIDPIYQKECGACHTPFPAQFLPKRSWDLLLTGLNKHFGEDATLPPKSIAAVKAYLESHAADTAMGAPRAMRDVPTNATPMRITEMPFWTRIHARQIERHAFAAPKIKSAANCTACHRGAVNGVYEDE